LLGAKALAFGTYLRHLGLADRLAVERASNAYAISEALSGFPKTIQL